MHITLTRALGLICLTLVGCGAPSQGSTASGVGSTPGLSSTPAAVATNRPEPVTLSYGHPVISSLYWHIFVGQDQGLFAAEGIQLEPVFVSQGVPAIAQGTVGGAYQVASISGDAGILAVEQGAPLVYVGGEAHKAVFGIIVQPEITSWADFKGQGKTIGAASVRGGTSTVFRWILRSQGLHDGPDFSFVAAGSTSERVAALRSKAIDAGLMAQPQDFQMQDAGFRALGLTSDYLPRYAMAEVAVRRDWAESNADVLVRYLRANIRALHWLYDPANRAAAVRILEQYTKTEPVYAERSYELLIQQLAMFARNGEVEPAALEGTMQVLLEEGELASPAPPIGKYIDTRYWEQAIAGVGRR